MKNLVVALDLSETTATVLAQARPLSECYAAKLWLIHAAQPDPDFVGFDVGPVTVRKSVADHFHEEHRQLQALAEGLRTEGFDCTALLIQGATVEVILKEAADLAADMIIVGSHGHGLVHQLILGSTSEGVIRKSRIPVLVVPTG